MEETEGRYINPYTDYGFKYLFGTEPNKEFTLAFLNELLRGEEVIKSLTLIPSEQLGDTKNDRRAVFDVYAENDRGEKIIIEMQKADQQYFKDRSVYYSSFPIRSQGEKGKWKFGLKGIYTIGILDFVFDEDKDDEEYYHHTVKLMDVEKKEGLPPTRLSISQAPPFYDNLTYIYLEMPKFNKTENELDTLFDKWLYALKNLPRLLERPAALQERIFKKFFDVAQTANLSKEEYAKYFESEKIYHDLDGAFRTASHKGFASGMKKGLAEGLAEGLAKGMEKGLAEGLAEGMEKGLAKGMEKGLAEGMEKGLAEGQQKEKAETVRRLNQMGLTLEQIAEGVNMTTEEINSILS